MSRWLPLLVFVLATGAHAAYFSRANTERVVCIFDAKGNCVEDKVVRSAEKFPSRAGFATYLKEQDFFLGLSYALAFGFAAYALTHLRRSRRRAAAGAVAGGGVGSLLLAGGCFLVGCCGSPMLAVWLSLFGAKAVGLAKPLIAALTALSIVGGYVCLRRGGAADCCQTPAERVN
jgi:hypothetical protein